MGRTGHGRIGHKSKGARLNPEYKTAPKVSNNNTDLIENVPKTPVKNKL